MAPLAAESGVTSGAGIPAAGPVPERQAAAAAAAGPSSLAGRLWRLLCSLASPLRLLKTAYWRWYDARARRRFVRRQRRWRRDCAVALTAAERRCLAPAETGLAAAGWPEDDRPRADRPAAAHTARAPTGAGRGSVGADRRCSGGGAAPSHPLAAAPSASGASGGDRLNSAGLQERLEENRRQLAALGEAPDPEVARYLEDERVALMLQNEEFMDELRRNREFMDALDVDTPQFAAAQRYDGYESLDETQRPPKDSSHVHKYPDDEVFKERLKHMGKASRKKFAQLARLFHFNRRGGARAMLGHGPVPSGDQLLLSEDPLTADDLEQDEPGPAAPFEDRHTVETYRGEGKSPGRHHHQMV